MMKKSINDITLFRYLFNLDNRNLPESIINWYKNVGSVVDSDRENAIKELAFIKGDCRNLVVFSKTFVDSMDKSYMKFTQFHMDILEELLLLGGLGIQYCIKSELAYSKLHEVKEELLAVNYDEFNEKYNHRDVMARKKMRDLVDSDANKVTKVFSTLFER